MPTVVTRRQSAPGYRSFPHVLPGGHRRSTRTQSQRRLLSTPPASTGTPSLKRLQDIGDSQQKAGSQNKTATPSALDDDASASLLVTNPVSDVGQFNRTLLGHSS